MKLRVVAVNASPRARGNTYDMLSRALEPLQEAGWQTDLLQIGRKSVRGCSACFKCFKNKDMRCVLPEDAVSQAMPYLLAADAVILGSPVYFSSVTTEMKALLDRTGIVALGNGNVMKGRIGAAVVALRRGGDIHAYDTINHFFLMSHMIVPGSSFWNMGFGEMPGDVVKDDREAVHNMTNLGKTIAWLGGLLAPAREGMPELWNRYADIKW